MPPAGAPGYKPPRNECTILHLSSDVAPDTNPDTTQDPSAPQNPNQDSHNDFSNTDWMPLNDHPQPMQETQECLQGLAIGTILPGFHRESNTATNNNTSYGHSNSGETASSGLSPDSTSNSNRPTPNSTNTPSDQPLQNKSGHTSYETSPVPSHTRPPQTGNTPMNQYFNGQPDYSGIGAGTGLTPQNGNEYGMPETPDWARGQGTGLTPVGEGVFRQLMGLGPLDPMDLGWDGGS